ncbi:MAG: hypothetical protein ACXWI7_07295 [Croceibacterium sp.]
MTATIRVRDALTIAFVVTALAACHRGEQAPVEAKRISLSDVRSQGEQPLPSPDTKGAGWSVSASGQAIDFGRPSEKPFVSLLCSVKASQPQVTLVRHAPARPGEKALFPVIGNRIISRFKVDATLVDREWRWQGTLPADDPLFEVFQGPRELEATLPGGGTVKIAGSAVPGQFLAWCRAGGKAPAVEGDAKKAEAAG